MTSAFRWVVVLLAWPIVALAQADDGSFVCQPGGLPQERNVCAIEGHRTADRAMGRQYRKVLASLDAAQQAKLLQAQRRWIRQREARCEKRTKSLEGGNAWAVAFYRCLESGAQQRTRALSALPASRELR